MKHCSVSIVVPTFNRAALLGDAIDSCLSQTHACEVIVINHGSTDNTDNVARAFGDRIVYISRERDFGPHFCWLEGVMHATGDFVHLHYDDDLIHPHFVDSCLKVMDDETGLAFCAVEVFDERTGKTDLTLYEDWAPETGIYGCDRFEANMLHTLVSPGAILCRKQDMIDALYQGRLPLAEHTYHGVGPDYLVTLLALLRYPKIGYVREVRATFRAHDGSITIDAQGDDVKTQKIKAAYEEVRQFYWEQKDILEKRTSMRPVSRGNNGAD